MKIEQKCWIPATGWECSGTDSLGDKAQLVLVFGERKALVEQNIISEVRSRYPKAILVGCSTAGEIGNDKLLENSVVVTAVQFEKTRLDFIHANAKKYKGSSEVGVHLGKSLKHEGLVHAFVLSDGLSVNGSQLIQGISEGLPPETSLTGGLAGDYERFEETLLCIPGDRGLEKDEVGLLGFYGDQLKVGWGSMGGFSPFGPERVVTRSEGNVLYELDGESALEVYKRYLGPDRSKDLSANQFFFPLSYHSPESGETIVRTILGVDEEKKSMIFAGDIPQGSMARLMKSNHFKLVEGAEEAAKSSLLGTVDSPGLAILISCVGRKIIMKQRTEEELDAIRGVLGNDTVLTGFYSYGEITHFEKFQKCELQNQTMTITTLKED